MSNHDFDLLAKAAFNETSPDEDRLIEEWLANDAEAQQAKREFDGLREGLRSLADVPECQLSNERLRDAILSQGVKPKTSAFQAWKWAVPTLVAACATALAVTVYRPVFNSSAVATNQAPFASRTQSSVHQTNDLGPVATNQDINTKSGIDLDSHPDLDGPSKSAQQAALKAMANASNQQDVFPDVPEQHWASEPVPTSRHAKSADRAADKPKSDPAVDYAKLVAADLAHVTLTSTTDPAPKMTMAADSAARSDESAMKDTKSSPQVVVLGSSLQPDTRAQGAVEIQNDDVVFGG